jgi:hypothetical protein
MSGVKSKKNILKNLILFLSSLIIALCVAEYAARKIDIEGPSWHRMYIGMYDSKVSLAPELLVIDPGKITRFDMGNCYPSNPAGRLPLRIINPADGKYWYCVLYNKKQRCQGFNPERKRQIAIVGDSFTFGMGVKETDTLGYLLNERYPEINFQNLGKRGASTDDVAKICNKIEKLKLKVEEVIYFYNLNDVRLSKTVESREKDILMLTRRKDEVSVSPVLKELSKSALFSLIRKLLVLNRKSSLSVQNYKDMYFSEENRREFISTMDEIKSMKYMLAQHGISFRVVIYPLIYKDLLGRYPFESIHAQIINACNERKIMCLDGYAPFKSYYFMKKFTVHLLDTHPNGLSNRELVNYIRKKDFVTDRANMSKR